MANKRVGEVNFPETQHEKEFFLGEATEPAAVQGDDLSVSEFKVDTGAHLKVISISLYHSLKPTPSLSRDLQLAYESMQTKFDSKGTFTSELKVSDKVAKELAYVIDDLQRTLLGTEPAE